MSHHCHARGCPVPVAPKFLMCGRHWRRVPLHLQAAVWRHYRPGQEVDKQPTPAYLLAAEQAIMAVAVREGRYTQEWADAHLKTFEAEMTAAEER
jgi:hypothetical protein